MKKTIALTSSRLSPGMFSGRVVNIGYQIARLGTSVQLITEVGEDFFQLPYKLTCSYADHLKDAGISVVPLVVNFTHHNTALSSKATRHKLLCNYGYRLLRSGVLKVSEKRTAFIISLSDNAGRDIFFFDDTESASDIAEFRPVPTELLSKLDSIIVSSGNNRFNRLVVDAAFEIGLDIFFDVGLFEPSSDFLRNVVMKSTIVFGNPREISAVCKAFGISSDHPDHIFLRAKPRRLRYIISVEKEKGTIFLFKRNSSKPTRIGPIPYVKTGTGIGACDAITGGTVSLFVRGYPIEICCKAGLIAGGAVWKSCKIQEPMFNWEELVKEYASQFGQQLPFLNPGSCDTSS